MNNKVSDFIGVLIVSISLLLTSCIRTVVLRNGITKVPINEKNYRNRVYCDSLLKKEIESTVFYEKVNLRYQKLYRIDDHVESTFYGMFKFYSNGNVNYFLINKSLEFSPQSVDPSFCGYRGVYYRKNDNIKVDLFSITSELGSIGKKNKVISFGGDTLYVTDERSMITEIYIKRELPLEYFQYIAEW
jgi:hypothetical protein